MNDLHALLEEHGHRTEDGRWWFSAPHCTHSEEEALAIIEACQMLGVPVTDYVTSGTWLALVRKVQAMEERLDQLTESHYVVPRLDAGSLSYPYKGDLDHAVASARVDCWKKPGHSVHYGECCVRVALEVALSHARDQLNRTESGSP